MNLYLRQKNDAVAVYELLEWLKSRSLVERLRLVHTTPPSSLSHALFQRESDLRSDLRERETAVHTSRTPQQRERNMTELEAAWNRYNTLLDELTPHCPEFVAIKRGQGISFEQVRALLY